jgi:hypothetical protein
LTAAGTIDEIAVVLDARIPLYRDTAHATLDTLGVSVHELARRIEELLEPPPA